MTEPELRLCYLPSVPARAKSVLLLSALPNLAIGLYKEGDLAMLRLQVRSFVAFVAKLEKLGKKSH